MPCHFLSFAYMHNITIRMMARMKHTTATNIFKPVLFDQNLNY